MALPQLPQLTKNKFTKMWLALRDKKNAHKEKPKEEKDDKQG